MRVTWGWAPTPRDEQAAEEDRTAVRHTDRPTDHHTPHEGTTDHV